MAREELVLACSHGLIAKAMGSKEEIRKTRKPIDQGQILLLLLLFFTKGRIYGCHLYVTVTAGWNR
jgi:hypothetical protein